MEKKKNVLKIYCDGGSRGNPGIAASAFVVTKDEEVIDKGSKFFKKATNNEAEYCAVLLAMEWLNGKKEIGSKYEGVVFNLDSQLVERQLNGFYKVKNENLKKYFLKIKKIEGSLSVPVKFIWNYRDENTLADELANETMDANS